jgi:hypothetical protein
MKSALPLSSMLDYSLLPSVCVITGRIKTSRDLPLKLSVDKPSAVSNQPSGIGDQVSAKERKQSSNNCDKL